MRQKGTIFFDEIGNVSMKMQMDLLPVLETKNSTRLGRDKQIEVDFRVISATNRDLEKAIHEGHFREDLYFRLNVVTITIPPWRDRKQDIPMLTRFIFNKYSQSMSKPIKDISSEAMDVIINYEWPGNVRELSNVIERAIVVCDGDKITVDDLSFPFKARTSQVVTDDGLEAVVQTLSKIFSLEQAGKFRRQQKFYKLTEPL